MQEYTIIFIGKSGCGKGTQIKQLTDFLISKGENSIEYVQSGQGLRDFIAGDSYTSKKTQEINAHGKLYPTFIAIWSWVDGMIKNFTGQKILIVDGAPRKLNEARIMDEMFDFYGRNKRIVINLEVSDEWASERLHERKRGDDLSEDNIKTRLGWYSENSPEIIDFFTKNEMYSVIKINGEQAIEDVQKDIRNALSL